MQTPAIRRPTIGRTSGLPAMTCGPATAAPQLEQNRALSGNEIPQRLQKNAMIDPSSRSPCHTQHTEKSLGRFHGDGFVRADRRPWRKEPPARQVLRKMTNEVESLRMIFTVQVDDPGPLRIELRLPIRRCSAC